MAIPRRISMTLITTIISISVKPRLPDWRLLLILTVLRPACFKPLISALSVPARIDASIARRLVGPTVDRSDASLVRIPRLLWIFLLRHPAGAAARDVFGDELQ